MRTIIEYMQRCHIRLYQKIARKKVARVNAAISLFFVTYFIVGLMFYIVVHIFYSPSFKTFLKHGFAILYQINNRKQSES